MKQKLNFTHGWILKNGSIVPYEYKNGQPLPWKETQYFKDGCKLLSLEQCFYLKILKSLERVS